MKYQHELTQEVFRDFIQGNDPTGDRKEILLGFMSDETLLYLTHDVPEFRTDVLEHELWPMTEEHLRQMIAEACQSGLQAVSDHEAASAARMMVKLTTLIWILDDQPEMASPHESAAYAMAQAIESNQDLPNLARLAQTFFACLGHLSLFIPSTPEVERLRAGQPCKPDCERCTDAPQEFRVTFSQRFRSERHPRLKVAHPDGWLTVMAPDIDTAAEAAQQMLGPDWSGIVHAADADYDWSLYPLGEVSRIVVERTLSLDLSGEIGGPDRG